MLTLQELKQIVDVPYPGMKIPTAKKLKEYGTVIAKKSMGCETEILAFQNGYALYQVSRFTILLYSCRGRGGQEIGRIGQESKTGCRRKRIIRNMQRISQRTALTVIFGIAGRMDVPKKNAIIGFCRRNLLKRKRRLGAVRDALMEDILLASGTACRRFCWK